MKKLLNVKSLFVLAAALFVTSCNNSLNMSEFKEKYETELEVGASIEDVEKPVLSKVVASSSREGVQSQTASTYVNGKFEDVLEAVGEEKFFALPYHTKSVWLRIDCSDDAGIEYIKCNEKTRYNVDGADLSNSSIADGIDSRVCNKKFLKGSGSRSAVFEYEFNENGLDGIVELTFTAVDYAGRESENSVTVSCIRDTYVTDYAGVDPSIDDYISRNNDNHWPDNWNNLNDWSRYMYMNEKSVDKFAEYNGQEYFSGCENFSADVYAGYSEDNLSLLVKNSDWHLYEGGDEGYSEIKTDWDTTRDYFIKTVTKDIAGNTASSIVCYPAIPRLLSVVYENPEGGTPKYVMNFESKVWECGKLTNYPSASYKTVYWNVDGSESLDNELTDDNCDDMVINNPDTSKIYAIRLYTEDSRYILSPVYTITAALTDSGVNSEIEGLYNQGTFEKMSAALNAARLPFIFNSSLSSSGYEKLYVTLKWGYEVSGATVTQESSALIYDRNDSSVKPEIIVPADSSYTYSYVVYGIKDGKLYNTGVKALSGQQGCSSLEVNYPYNADDRGKLKISVSGASLSDLVDSEGYYTIKASWNDLGGSKVKYIRANSLDTYFSYDQLQMDFAENGSSLSPITIKFEVTDKYGYTASTVLKRNLYERKYQYKITKNTSVPTEAYISYTAPQSHELGYTFIDELNPSSKKWGWETSSTTRISTGGESRKYSVENFYYNYGNKFIRLTGQSGYYYEPQYFYPKKDMSNVYGCIVSQQTEKVLFMSNEPVYVHTIYSAMDRGDSVYEWERWIPDEQKVNRKTFDLSSSSSTGIYQIDETDIPTGMYYRVLVHFADGTADISDVYRKAE